LLPDALRFDHANLPFLTLQPDPHHLVRAYASVYSTILVDGSVPDEIEQARIALHVALPRPVPARRSLE
jgi:hypothetical protein